MDNKKFIKSVVLFVFILFAFCGKTYGENKPIATISIDLDGVLNNYEKYDQNNIPEIREGAREFVKELHKSGYKLILLAENLY